MNRILTGTGKLAATLVLMLGVTWAVYGDLTPAKTVFNFIVEQINE